MSIVDQAKIIVIIPYFGQWPVWIDYFIKSCAYNPEITWLIYTDCGEPNQKADNVCYKHMSFKEYTYLVSERLNISFLPKTSYKLCDIKPALGFIHEEEVEQYDYWAFGDIDVIYGDIKSYLTDNMLSHNLISFHKHRVSGHLCLIKNTDKMNKAFMRYKGWKVIFEDPEHRCFDEKHFNSLFISHKNWPKWLRDIVYYPRYFMRTAYFKESHSTNNTFVPWVDGSFDFPEFWQWGEGKLYAEDDRGREFPYLHFLHWKREWNSNKCFKVKVEENNWVIRESGFSSKELN